VVDLWNHLEIIPENRDGKSMIPVTVEPFDRNWLNSRREGNAGCIGVFPKLLKPDSTEGRVFISAPEGMKIVITNGNPGYHIKQETLSPGKSQLEIGNLVLRSPAKVVIQLFDSAELADELVLFLPGKPANAVRSTLMNGSLPHGSGKPKMISLPASTPAVSAAPQGMADIPAGSFRFYTKRDPATLDPFIPFPDFSDTVTLQMPHYFMDIAPVTNELYHEYLLKSGHVPTDTTGFLRHWNNGQPSPGTEKEPVVFVNLEDAREYCRYYGKRLPTEQEWQYAAQGTDMRKYPWGNQPDSTRCNDNLNRPTPVDKFPGGAGPFGTLDMIGNVWQMTADVYDNGAYFFNIIRGGSYYHPTQSIWYVTGGPLPADHPEMLLLIAPGLDRNATVGFRCVKDAGSR
jgi:formylglycine-generating enzyme required for sulfatase activity